MEEGRNRICTALFRLRGRRRCSSSNRSTRTKISQRTRRTNNGNSPTRNANECRDDTVTLLKFKKGAVQLGRFRREGGGGKLLVLPFNQKVRKNRTLRLCKYNNNILTFIESPGGSNSLLRTGGSSSNGIVVPHRHHTSLAFVQGSRDAVGRDESPHEIAEPEPEPVVREMV